MGLYRKLAQSVHYTIRGTKVTVLKQDASLKVVGAGRSAYVFKIGGTNKVLKVYYPSHAYLAQEEAEIYNRLEGLSAYPKLHESGSNYIVIDYIDGNTLFDCLVKGIPINGGKLAEIDEALTKARYRGLNPSDIHLKNIFITLGGNIKIIDVARFRQAKQCRQWKDLKKGYQLFYKHRWCPKKWPPALLNFVAIIYKRRFVPNSLRSHSGIAKIGKAEEM
ncbi:hypothetical protein A8F94_17975 [Bacillus sp. FJAT-27225]|uniref:hypothetical protein n=1 Tax=Bacillus sp. FJAT-27225 TaxID=1743144 RepID=UPI00080C2261|nr:hypothetical protein [Bacillus sp. FJAT-27225]OCA83033.1 hypothetical protein A8F94_17975 [Bacillus sp. FJAT-27225]